MKTIHVTINESKTLAWLLLFIHIGATICALFSPIIMPLKIFITVFCIISFITYYKKYAVLTCKNSVVSFWLEDGIWYLQNRDEQMHTAQLKNNSHITLWYTLLNFKLMDNKSSINIPIFRDAVDKDAYRKLIIHYQYMAR